MDSNSQSKAAYWGGWVMGVLPALLLVFSAWMKLSGNPQAVDGFAKLGFPEGVCFKIGLIELACAILYLVPQTAVIGAILITGYMGGAIVTHIRISEPIYVHILIGVAVWGGLFLRDLRVRALIPLRW